MAEDPLHNVAGLQSTFIILLILAIGNIFRGNFDMFYQLVGNNGLLYNATDVIDTYVSLFAEQLRIRHVVRYRLYQSVLCLVTLVATNC
jgi:putative aldouronate transport system permease protein